MDIIAIKIKKNLQVRSHSLSEREIAYLSKLVNMLRSWLKVTTGDLFKNIYLCTLAKHMNFTCKHHFKFLKIIYYVVKFKSSNFTTVKLAQIIMFANYKRWLENCYPKKKKIPPNVQRTHQKKDVQERMEEKENEGIQKEKLSKRGKQISLHLNPFINVQTDNLKSVSNPSYRY